MKRLYRVDVDFEFPPHERGEAHSKDYLVEASSFDKAVVMGGRLATTRYQRDRRAGLHGYIPRVTAVQERGTIDAR